MFSEQEQGAHGDRDDAISLSLAVNMDELAHAIDVLGLKVCAFAQAQSAGVDRDETDAIDSGSDLREDLGDFISREHDRKLGLARRASDIEDAPLLLQRFLVEELDAAQGDGDGAALELALVLEVEEVAAEFFFIDQVRGSVVVLGQLADAGHVDFQGSFGVASKFKVIDHALT